MNILDDVKNTRPVSLTEVSRMSLDDIQEINNKYEYRKDSSSSGTPSSHTDTSDTIIDVNPIESVTIENIQEEENLIEYTQNHFTNRVNEDLLKLRNDNTLSGTSVDDSGPLHSLNRIYSLENVGELRDHFFTNFDSNFQDNYIRSNSPITIANTGSRPGSLRGSNSGSDNEDDNNSFNNSYSNIEPNNTVSSNLKINGLEHGFSKLPAVPELNRSFLAKSQTPTISSSEFSRSPTMLLRNISDSLQTPSTGVYVPLHPPSTSTYGNVVSGSLHNNHKRIKKYKQIGDIDIEKMIDKYYDDDVDNKYSSDIDVLTTYIKGQKNLYIQSKHITQLKLNWLRFPALLFTALVTVVAPFIQCQPGSGGIISAINAVAALCISIINYLKLEASSEIYLQLANQYDKLETSLELANNTLVILNKEDEKNTLMLNKIKEAEQKMMEIKESNTILIPEEIKMLFPIICHINIFSFINKIDTHKKRLVTKFKDVKNEIRFILHKWEKQEHNGTVGIGGELTLAINSSTQTPSTVLHTSTEFTRFPETTVVGNLYPVNIERLKEKRRLLFLYEIKDKLKNEIMDYRNAYGNIDDLFTKEIKRAESKKIGVMNCFLCLFCKPNMKVNISGLNPVVDKYFHFMFVDE